MNCLHRTFHQFHKDTRGYHTDRLTDIESCILWIERSRLPFPTFFVLKGRKRSFISCILFTNMNVFCTGRHETEQCEQIRIWSFSVKNIKYLSRAVFLVFRSTAILSVHKADICRKNHLPKSLSEISTEKLFYAARSCGMRSSPELSDETSFGVRKTAIRHI